MKKIFLIILISLTLTPLISKAQEYTLIEPLPCIADTGNNCSPGETIKKISLNTYIDYVFKFSIALAAFLAVVMIIFGGFQYMTSEVPGIKSDGKEKIKNAIFGLIMILASYLILQTIDPRLVEVTTEIKPIEVDRGALIFLANQISSESLYLSLEDVRNIENIKYENANNQSRIDKLESQLEDPYAEPLTEAELIELEKLKTDVNKGVVSMSQISASAAGHGSFARVYDIIHNSSSTLDRSPIKAGEDVIKEVYGQKIGDIDKIGTAQARKDAETLGKQKDFYLKQIKEEELIRESINRIENSIFAPNRDEVLLNEKLTESKSGLANPTNAVALGISLDQYTKMMQTRIDLIEKTLKKK